MLFKDSYLLEKAYLSVSQPVPSVPSDEEVVPAGIEPSMEVSPSGCGCGIEGCQCGSEEACTCGSHNPEAELDVQDEADEDSMAIDNLNSVRESALKIALYWESGGHLEPWQQQKLAIVMNSLAEIARSLR